MKKIKYVLCFVILFFSIQLVSFSQAAEKLIPWHEALRKALTLDKPIKSDSSFIYTNYNQEFQFFINKERPDIIKAFDIIDTLTLHQASDTTIGRLITILQEFDVRYQAEFAYSIDYFRNVYHYQNNNLGKELNEFRAIEKLEHAINLFKLKSLSPQSFANVLIGREPQYFKKEYSISNTWRQFGHTDISYLRNYYKNNKEVYEEAVINLLKSNLTRQESASMFHLLGIWDTSPPKVLDCDFFNAIVDENTAPNFIKAMNEFNEYWHKQECIRALVKHSSDE